MYCKVNFQCLSVKLYSIGLNYVSLNWTEAVSQSLGPSLAVCGNTRGYVCSSLDPLLPFSSFQHSPRPAFVFSFPSLSISFPPSPWTSSICLSLFYQIKCLYINFMLLQAAGRQWWACDGWVIHIWIEGWFLAFLLKLMALSKVQIDPRVPCALITFWIMLWKPLAWTKCCFFCHIRAPRSLFSSPDRRLCVFFVLEQCAVFYCGSSCFMT